METMFYSSLRISPSEVREKKRKGEKNTTKLERVKKPQSLNQSILTRSFIQISALLFTTAAFCFFSPGNLQVYQRKKKNTLVFKLQQSERSRCPGSTSLFFSPRFAVLLLKRSIFFSIKLSDNEFPTLAERSRLQINKWRRRWNFL